MPADEVTTGSGVDAARVRTGPRHAAPKKPLFTRFHMPAGKAIALAAMPTAVLMGMGFTPTLANAEDQPTSKSLTIDEYKDCVAALEDSEGADASASPSASASESADDAKDDTKDDAGSGPKDEPTGGTSDSSGGTGGSGDSTSPDSGSGEADEPAPAASSAASEPQDSQTSGDTGAVAPSPAETDKNLLETIGDTITDLFDGKDAEGTDTASPAPSASESASTGTGADKPTDTGSGPADSGKDSGTAKDTSDALTDAAKDAADKADDTAKTTEDKADKADEAAEAAEDAADATASPSPSESATTDVDDCPVATEDESGIDNKTPLPDDPWYLDASSLLLKGADYQGIVEVKTANGTKKKVLKYVISEGTDIGDLHQRVDDKQAGVTHHVQAGSGTTSTIRNGDTIMYTESISGNLFGLIPVTFDPENPPPLNIPLIYFTKVKVVQAGQFGGDLHIPGMHLFNTK
ncbi:hypothetical protein [Streptomyces phaeoluteigriseus]|uniref:hypothetical protein n=1 Tax=Streptomyces phaeoluteigriseus TaxID=114686 RepID=UPI003680F611